VKNDNYHFFNVLIIPWRVVPIMAEASASNVEADETAPARLPHSTCQTIASAISGRKSH
jgi:hypothetical protein